MAAGAFVSARLRRAETAAPPAWPGRPTAPGRPPPGAEGPGARAGGAYPRPGPAGPSQGVAAHPSPTGGRRARAARTRAGARGSRPWYGRPQAGHTPPPRTPLRLPSGGCVKRPSKTQRRASAKCLPALPYAPANAPVFPSYFLFGFLFMFSSRIKSSNKDVSVGVNISHFPS